MNLAIYYKKYMKPPARYYLPGHFEFAVSHSSRSSSSLSSLATWTLIRGYFDRFLGSFGYPITKYIQKNYTCLFVSKSAWYDCNDE